MLNISSFWLLFSYFWPYIFLCISLSFPVDFLGIKLLIYFITSIVTFSICYTGGKWKASSNSYFHLPVNQSRLLADFLLGGVFFAF